MYLTARRAFGLVILVIAATIGTASFMAFLFFLYLKHCAKKDAFVPRHRLATFDTERCL